MRELIFQARPVCRKDKKINILYIIDELNIGGTEKQLLTTIESLDRDRFAPHLVCLRKSQFYTCCNIDCPKQVLDVTSLFSLNGLRKLSHLVLYLKKNKIDIVQTYFFDSNLFGVIAARIACVSKIISCRRDMGFWYSSRLLRVLRWLNIFVDRFLVNSIAIKENIVRAESIPERKIDVIYNGIFLEHFENKRNDADKIREKYSIQKGDFVVGIVANLNRPVKRVDIFLRAAAGVLEKKENVSFVIVGGGDLEESLESLASSLGIRGKVIFTGPQKDILPFLSIFDLGVLASDSEGFSNSILEYMATGLPVVCTDTGGNRELVENEKNGFLIPVSAHEKMADRILDVLGDRGIQLKMREKNLKKIQRFSWDSIIRLTQKYYYDLIFDKKQT